MTSRYRAAQRAVELFNALQGEGLTTDEIAAELRRRGALDRKRASDPAADLYANVLDMVADFAKAMGQPLAEDALRARAEAAERRAEAAEAEVGCLRAELAVMPRPEDRCHGAWPCEASTALASAEAEAARWEARAEALAAELAQARAEGEAAGRAAERERIAAWLQAHSGGAPSGLWDAYALTLMASRIRAGDVVPDIGAGAHVGALRTAP